MCPPTALAKEGSEDVPRSLLFTAITLFMRVSVQVRVLAFLSEYPANNQMHGAVMIFSGCRRHPLTTSVS